ncbi:MAG: hypothetical protein ACKVVP_12240 [Chloroflexota bacterium]
MPGVRCLAYRLTMTVSSTQVFSTLRVLREHGLQVASLGDRLTCAVPNSMTPEHVMAWLRRHRERILQILSIEDGQLLAPSELSLQHLYYVRFCVHRGLLSELLSDDRAHQVDRALAVAV